MSISSSNLSFILNLNEKKANINNKVNNKDDFYGDYYLDDGNLKKKKGLSWLVAALFITADMAGVGIIALPYNIIQESGFYVGIFLVIFVAIIGTLSAIVLGKSWVIMLRMFPIYRTHCRKPYSEMGYRACGKKMRTLVSIILNITQFSIGVTFLLLLSSSIVDFFEIGGKEESTCSFIIVIAAFLVPIILLKSPTEFWLIIVISMLSTLIAVLFIYIGTAKDFLKLPESKLSTMVPQEFNKILRSFGIILFTFGGHSALPTVQHDMRNPNNFTKSSIWAFSIIALLNLTVVIIGAATYGMNIGSKIVSSIEDSLFSKLINGFIIIHCFSVFPFMINPLNQEIEELFRISHKFGVKRVLIRFSLLFLMMFVALTIPKFEPVMVLLGASTLTITSLVFPPIFYLYLSGAEKYKREMVSMNTFRKIENEKQIIENGNKDYDDSINFTIGFKDMLKYNNGKMLFVCVLILSVGIIFGSIATYFAIESLIRDFSNETLTPCYFSWYEKIKNITISNNNKAKLA